MTASTWSEKFLLQEEKISLKRAGILFFMHKITYLLIFSTLSFKSESAFIYAM